jgi:hypothetical protein
MILFISALFLASFTVCPRQASNPITNALLFHLTSTLLVVAMMIFFSWTLSRHRLTTAEARVCCIRLRTLDIARRRLSSVARSPL